MHRLKYLRLPYTNSHTPTLAVQTVENIYKTANHSPTISSRILTINLPLLSLSSLYRPSFWRPHPLTRDPEINIAPRISTCQLTTFQ